MISTFPENDVVGDGLSFAEAQAQLFRAGPNELPQAENRGLWSVVGDVLRQPMFLFLLAGGAVYLAIGGIGEGVLMLAFALVTIVLVIVQEQRSENALAALRSVATPMARVRREGRDQRISSRDVVPNDLLLVADGERVAADAIVVTADNITVDESLLTGESMPVGKQPRASSSTIENSTLYAGTLVVSGRAVAKVTATGRHSATGRIGVSLATIRVEPSLMQVSLNRVVRVFALLGVCAAGLTVVLLGFSRGLWLQALLSGIALGMALLPEEFPMILGVFVALGAHRLAKLRVLVRRTSVIEDLGACTTLCVDKTGTLTENRMRVREIVTRHHGLETHGDTSASPVTLLQAAALASPRRSNDPMDEAVHHAAEAAGLQQPAGSPTHEWGITRERPAVARAWPLDASQTTICIKGAPETVANLCNLDRAARDTLLADVDRLAARGDRVLAVAHATIRSTELTDDLQHISFSPLGLLAFTDPLRTEARAAVQEAQRAGIAVTMITGDHPTTAMTIAREAGIVTDTPAATGADIDAADDESLRVLVKRHRVFARVRHDQKLRLVEALKADGEIVAMTGDGVNDAPALKAAHIGLAMGGRGTDVAREAASIVLLDDDLTDLVAGIAMGRRVFDNLRKAAIYIAAVHIPICGLALVPLLIGIPPLLMPLHVVLIEMLIDPMCAIAFEREPVEPEIMRQPPRERRDSLLGVPQLIVAGFLGTLLLIASLLVYAVGLSFDVNVATARTLTFIAFTAGNLALIAVIASRDVAGRRLFARERMAYWAISAITLSLLTAAVMVPALGASFQFERPPIAFVILAFSAGIGAVLAAERAKVFPFVQHALGRTRLLNPEVSP